MITLLTLVALVSIAGVSFAHARRWWVPRLDWRREAVDVARMRREHWIVISTSGYAPRHASKEAA